MSNGNTCGKGKKLKKIIIYTVIMSRQHFM